MPYTISHIATVLPFHRPLRRLGLFSAAAIGTMAPDLDLILPIRLAREQTHGLWALLTFCLPVGLAAWAVFQALIKPALIEVLPTPLYARLYTEHHGQRLASVMTWLYAGLAVLLGALTHIAWDAFTHEDGSGMRMLSELAERDPDLGGSQQLLRWLQHGSTVAGMAAVLVAVFLWVRHAKQLNSLPERRLPASERNHWMSVYALIPIMMVAAAVAQTYHNGWPPLYSVAAMTQFAVTGTYGCLLALVFTSALIRRRLLVLGSHHAPTDA